MEVKKSAYAILMSKKQVQEGICFYVPEYVMSGDYIEDDDFRGFEDEYGNEYYMMTDPQNMSSAEYAAAYPVSEEELLKNYDEDINMAKTMFLNDIRSKSHIGFKINLDDTVIVMNMNFEALHQKYNEMSLDPDCNFVIDKQEILNTLLSVKDTYHSMENEEYIEEEKDEDYVERGQPALLISIDHFLEILNSDSLESMKEKLEAIGNVYRDYLSEKNLNDIDNMPLEEMSYDQILALIEGCYQFLLTVDDIEEFKKHLIRVEDIYLHITTSIDDKDCEEEFKEDAKDFLYTVIDNIDLIVELENLDAMKNSLSDVYLENNDDVKDLVNELKKYNDYEDKIVKDNVNKKESKKVNAKELKEYLDKIIIGQEEAKKDIISAIIMNQYSEDPKDRNSIFLVGPTGSGKTLIVQSISDYLDTPIAIVDTTQLTVSGYVGANVSDCLSKLLSDAKGDLEKAEHGIVVFDELDKKGSKSNDDISGKGVLNSLLPFIQGTTYQVSYNNRKVNFDTKNLTIFATGACTDVNKLSGEDGYKGNGIGFGVVKKEEQKQDIEYKKLTREDLEKYGNIPIELLGRFSTVTQLEGHTKESLKTILTSSSISPLLSEKGKLEKLGCELSWTDEYLDKAAEKALELKTGARSLKTTVEETIKKARWEYLNNPEEYSEIILTGKTIDDSEECILVGRMGGPREGSIILYKDIKEGRNNSIERPKVYKIEK